MKTASAELIAHLAQEVTTLATCWKVTRRDGVIYGFTDHDIDIVYGGVSYEAAAGYTPTAVETSAALNVDNLDVDGILDSGVFEDADIAAGVWDGAAIDIFEVNYTDLTQGTLAQRSGTLGEIRTTRGRFVAELRGMMQSYAQAVGDLYSPGCRARLGDARCGVSLAAWTVSGTVTGTTSARVFADSGRAEAAGYFDFGKLTWLTGDNAGRAMEVKAYSPGAFTLVLPMGSPIAAGDTYSVHAGCGKRFVEDCQTRFANVVNFRGEPHVPGIDALTRGVE